MSPCLNRYGFNVRGSDANQLVDNRTIQGQVGFLVTSGEGNELRANHARDADTGIAVAGSGNVIVDNVLTQASIEVSASANTITHNEVAGEIRVAGSQHALMGNHVQEGGFVVTGSENTFTENTVAGSNVSTAFRLNGATGNVFTENLVNDALVGFRVAHSRSNSFIRNTISAKHRGLGGRAITPHNTFIDNTGLGLGATLTVREDMTLQEEFEGRIVINAGGITLDCAGHRIIPAGEDASYAAVGIEVHGFDDVTVKNCNAEAYKVAGIALIDATGGQVTGNNATIWLRNSTASAISGTRGEEISLENQSHRNSITDNTVESITVKNSNRNTVRGNVVESIRLKTSNHNTVTHNALTTGALQLIESDRNSVIENAINSSNRGIEVMAGSHNTIVGNTLSDTRIGIAIRRESADNVVESNTVTDSDRAFEITNSNTTTLTRNTVTDVRLGFRIRNSHDNVLQANELENTDVGLEANTRNDRTYGNTLVDNIGM